MEPLPLDDPLLKLDNVILTAHAMAKSEDGTLAASNFLIKKVLQMDRGEVPDFLLNPEVLEGESFKAKLARPRQ